MTIGSQLRRLLSRFTGRGRQPGPDLTEFGGLPREHVERRGVTLRVSAGLFTAIRAHVEDFRDGEQAGFLICRTSLRDDGSVALLALRWIQIPNDAKMDNGRSALAWTSAFTAECITEADQVGGVLVLVHSHGAVSEVELSKDDRDRAAELFPAVSRILAGRPSGTVVLGESVIDGLMWIDGRPDGVVAGLAVIGAPVELWELSSTTHTDVIRRRLERQNRALGERSDGQLARARVAILGCSGGGSHVFQQLAYAGVGTLIPVDGETVEEANMSRLVGAVPADIGRVLKVHVMKRLANMTDPTATVIAIPNAFPHPTAIGAMKTADVIVSCVDSWSAREQINAFARRYLIPLVDIGIQIDTCNGVLRSAHGQVLAVTPDSSCLRCSLVTDARLARERRERPPGYDLSPGAGDPQVVSMNGTLASEAVNAVFDLLTGHAGGRRGAGWWQYDGRVGTLERRDLPARRPGCSGCSELGLGDN